MVWSRTTFERRISISLTKITGFGARFTRVERNSRTELAVAVLSMAIFIAVLWFAPSLARALDDGPGSTSASARIPHEVLVGFRPGTTQEIRQRLLGSAGAEEAHGISGLPRARRISLENGQTVAEAISELSSDEEVAWVQPNLIGHISEVPDDPEFDQLWAFRNIGQSVGGISGTADADTDLDEAWDLGTGSGARIAVVDTGVDPTNPDLSAAMNETLSRNFAASLETGNVDSGDWQDQNGHGTHVAGTIAAVGDNGIGVAGSSWNTDLVAVRACDFDGYCDSATVASALAYAGSLGSRAVNVSLGFTGTESEMSVLRTAIAKYPDTLYIAAAGNEAANVEQESSWPCNIDLKNVICVAATDQSDRLAAFSNYGSTSVDLAAPGVNIISTVPQIVKKTDDELENGLSEWSRLPTGGWTLGTLTNGDSYIQLNVSGSDTSATLTTGNLDFSGGRSCSSIYYLSARLRSGQSLTQQYSVDGGSTWRTPGPYGPITSQSGIDDQDLYDMSSWLGAADGEDEVLVRFRYASTGASTQAPTVAIAYPLVTCVEGQPSTGAYDIYSGTSMATPQVTGAAALVAGYRTELELSELRTALLGSVDKSGSLSGRTVSGGRLNVRATMEAVSELSTGGNGQTGDGDDEKDSGSVTNSTMRILTVKRLPNGRARIRVRVSKAGRVWIRGTRELAPRSRRVSGASTVNLTVALRGSSLRRLNRRSRLRVRVTIGYRPVGGSNRFRAKWVTLLNR